MLGEPPRRSPVQSQSQGPSLGKAEAEAGRMNPILGKPSQLFLKRGHLSAYASELAWRENNRRVSNGEQYLMTTNAALTHPVSRQWKGYWQRSTRGSL
jgi:hypothetical protein